MVLIALVLLPLVLIALVLIALVLIVLVLISLVLIALIALMLIVLCVCIAQKLAPAEKNSTDISARSAAYCISVSTLQSYQSCKFIHNF